MRCWPSATRRTKPAKPVRMISLIVMPISAAAIFRARWSLAAPRHGRLVDRLREAFLPGLDLLSRLPSRTPQSLLNDVADGIRLPPGAGSCDGQAHRHRSGAGRSNVATPTRCGACSRQPPSTRSAPSSTPSSPSWTRLLTPRSRLAASVTLKKSASTRSGSGRPGRSRRERRARPRCRGARSQAADRARRLARDPRVIGSDEDRRALVASLRPVDIAPLLSTLDEDEDYVRATAFLTTPGAGDGPDQLQKKMQAALEAGDTDLAAQWLDLRLSVEERRMRDENLM